MNNDLVERYIYAATRRLSRKQREDVAQELRGLVDDLLTERCGGLTPTEKDIRVVLTELGTPQELYQRYDENAQKCLIGQPYYATYKFVMGIVLGAVAIGATVASLITYIIDPQGWLAAVAGWLSMAYNSMLAAFAIVTLLFAFFYHKGIRINEPFNFDDLPPVPKKTQEISKWESILGIGFCVLFAVLFLFTPEVFCAILEGTVISLFDMKAIQSSWLLIVAFAACGIIREVVQLMEGRYNRKVMITALISNLISAVLAFVWLLGFEVMNPIFLANMQAIFAGENSIVYRMFANFDVFFLGCMLIALVLDSVDVTVKTLRK